MVDKINRQELAAEYGFALAFLKSDPELGKLFDQAVKNTWTAPMFVAKLRATKWFQTHSASVRNAIMQETADPATYKANVKQMLSTVSDTYGTMFGDIGGDKQLRAWAETAHRMGWSEAQLIDRMTDSMNFRKLLRRKQMGGTAAEMSGQMDQMTRNYGVDLGSKWKARQLERVMSGDDTITGVQQRVKELAQREYKAFADRIEAGETVMDIAEPYMQKMADLLEMNPSDINLKAGMIQQALKQQDKDGKPAAMDLYTFEREVRKDKRWQHTKNAREEVSNVTHGLLRQFGLVSS